MCLSHRHQDSVTGLLLAGIGVSNVRTKSSPLLCLFL